MPGSSCISVTDSCVTWSEACQPLWLQNPFSEKMGTEVGEAIFKILGWLEDVLYKCQSIITNF